MMGRVVAFGTLLLGAVDLQEAPEYRIKANFLYNFCTREIVRWPDNAFQNQEDPFVIGILGQDPFEGELASAVQGRKAQGREIRIRRANRTQDLKGCHLVFVPKTTRQATRGVAAGLAGEKTLLVGEVTDFAERGGAINFYKEEGQIRFELNPDAAARFGIQLRARLLKLGRIVQDKKG